MREIIKENFLRKAPVLIKQFVENLTDVFITDASFDCHAMPKAFSLLT